MLELTDVLYEKHKRMEGVAWIILNRPEIRNALRTRTYEELTWTIRDAGDDDSVGVIVIRGAGDKAFSSGGDVNAQKERTRSSGLRHVRRILDLGVVIRNCGKPVIAAVNGDAVGGGHEVHLMCDITIAAEHARFGQVGPRVGSIPLWGGTQVLPMIVGDKRAREMIFRCKLYDAATAERWGLANVVVPLAELDAEVDRWCTDLLNRSPQSLRIAKTSLNSVQDILWSSYTHGAQLLASVMGNEENLEGVNAFLEKRPVNYKRFRGAPKEEV